LLFARQSKKLSLCSFLGLGRDGKHIKQVISVHFKFIRAQQSDQCVVYSVIPPMQSTLLQLFSSHLKVVEMKEAHQNMKVRRAILIQLYYHGVKLKFLRIPLGL
jgi:hypothetical protein